MISRLLLVSVLGSASADASSRVECPASCLPKPAVEALAREPLSVTIICRQSTITVRLDDGRDHVIEREVANSPSSCRALPELVEVLAGSISVTRATPPTPARPALKREATPSPAPVTAPTPDLPVETVSSPSVAPPVELSAPPAPPPQLELDAGAPLDAGPPRLVQVLPPAPSTPLRTLFLDVGAGAGVSPLVWLGEARVAWSGWRHAGLVMQGGFTGSTSTPLGGSSASSERQWLTAGAVFSLRAMREWGPRASLSLGAERVAGRGQGLFQNRGDAAVGIAAQVAVEWHQPLFEGLFLRAALGVAARPAPWSVRADSLSAVAWPQLGVSAVLCLGWQLEFGVSAPVTTLEGENGS